MALTTKHLAFEFSQNLWQYSQRLKNELALLKEDGIVFEEEQDVIIALSYLDSFADKVRTVAIQMESNK